MGGGEQVGAEGAGETPLLFSFQNKMKMFLRKSYLTCTLCTLCTPIEYTQLLYSILSIIIKYKNWVWVKNQGACGGAGGAGGAGEGAGGAGYIYPCSHISVQLQ